MDRGESLLDSAILKEVQQLFEELEEKDFDIANVDFIALLSTVLLADHQFGCLGLSNSPHLFFSSKFFHLLSD